MTLTSITANSILYGVVATLKQLLILKIYTMDDLFEMLAKAAKPCTIDSVIVAKGTFYCHEDNENDDRCKDQCKYCSEMIKQ
jgi:hypothetical protein